MTKGTLDEILTINYIKKLFSACRGPFTTDEAACLYNSVTVFTHLTGKNFCLDISMQENIYIDVSTLGANHTTVKKY